MNTLQNLIDNGIHPANAQRMLNDYTSKIGTMNGVYEIADITYDFNKRGRDVTLKCSLCGKEIRRMMIVGRNKWSELIKSCPCQKKLKEQQKKAEFEISEKLKKQKIYDDALSMIDSIYGDYKIIDFEFVNDIPTFKLKCMKCGDITTTHYQRVKNNAKTYSKCHKHFNPVKFDESYIGKKNNFLKVIGVTRTDKNRKMLVCECDCGNTKLIEPAIWEQGIVKSCGCKKSELSRDINTTHGLSGTRLYGIWNKMNDRCFNPNSQSYRNYGARGITVCKEWQGEQGLLNFVNWSENNGYSDDLTIDRINVNGNYEPSNCRWADWITQANNRRPPKEWKEREKSFEFEGEKYFLYELCEMFDTSEPAVRYRMNKLGMTLEQALKTPKLTDGRPKNKINTSAKDKFSNPLHDNSIKNTNDTNTKLNKRIEMPAITRNVLEEPRHSKAIINGKMYDTEKSKRLFKIGEGRILFITPKGNYFSCKIDYDTFAECKDGQSVEKTEQVYFDIQEEPEDRLREIFGRYDTEKYIELFGEPEEA